MCKGKYTKLLLFEVFLFLILTESSRPSYTVFTYNQQYTNINICTRYSFKPRNVHTSGLYFISFNYQFHTSYGKKDICI